ncbi:MAG: type IV pilus assembly protein PilM [Kiritimatiellae bacterium]|nr:type IV pilus assembly protein PilM [Kiritimatiellia bacterium]
MRADTILAMDIGASSVKLGLFAPRKGGTLELVGYAVREMDPDPANEEHRMTDVQLVLQEARAQLGIPTGFPVLISVPGQQVFSRFVKLPPVSRDKVLQMVQYEAQQNVPFPISEVVWDYQFLGSGVGAIDVMLAAMKAELVEQVVDVAMKAGLRPQLVDVAPLALYNAVRYSYSELPPCTLVIDIGARSTDLIFIEENRVFNRSIPVGGNAITQQIAREFDLPFAEAEQLKKTHAFVGLGGAYEAPASQVADKVSKTVRSVMTRLHSEITRSINFYRTQQSGGEPKLALLTGGSSIITYADEFLKEKLQIEVDYFNPFQSVAVASTIDAEEIGRRAHLLGEVVGLALRRMMTCPIEINLLPPRYVREETFRRRQPYLVAGMVTLLATLGVWGVGVRQLTSLNSGRLGELRGRLRELQAVEAQLKEKEDVIARHRGWLDRLLALPERATLWPQILADIRSRLLEGMWIVQFATLTGAEAASGAARSGGGELAPAPAGPPSPTEESAQQIKAIEITGYAYMDKVQQPDILKFRDRLRESPWFDETTDIAAMPQEGRDDFIREFTIRLVLKTPIQL